MHYYRESNTFLFFQTPKTKKYREITEETNRKLQLYENGHIDIEQWNERKKAQWGPITVKNSP